MAEYPNTPNDLYTFARTLVLKFSKEKHPPSSDDRPIGLRNVELTPLPEAMDLFAQFGDVRKRLKHADRVKLAHAVEQIVLSLTIGTRMAETGKIEHREVRPPLCDEFERRSSLNAAAVCPCGAPLHAGTAGLDQIPKGRRDRAVLVRAALPGQPPVALHDPNYDGNNRASGEWSLTACGRLTASEII